jgi:hypothetical protein
MTYSVDNNGAYITIAYEAQEITIPLDKATDLVVAVLDARKAGYAEKRAGKADAKIAAAKARAEKKAAREKAAQKRKADRVKKLEKQLAELKKAA